MSNYDIAKIEEKAKYLEQKAKKLAPFSDVQTDTFADEFYFVSLRELCRAYVKNNISKEQLLKEQSKIKNTYQKYALWASSYEENHETRLRLGQIAKEVYTKKECKSCLKMIRIFDGLEK